MAILLLDNFDSFTYNLVHYFEQNGVECLIRRNNVTIEEVQKLEFAGIVLSPGPEAPEKAGCMIEVIDHYHDKKPILGICLGHQALGEYFGMTLTKAHMPKHGKITRIKITPDPIFKDLPERFKVVQYNSLILKGEVNSDLAIIAETTSGEVMALKHNNLPLYGLQFHPEAAMTEYGLAIIKNWLVCSQIQY